MSLDAQFWKSEMFCRATLFSRVDEGQVPEKVSNSWQPFAQRLQECELVLTVSNEHLESPGCSTHAWPAGAIVEAGASAGDSLPSRSLYSLERQVIIEWSCHVSGSNEC